jgi:hypothetical protein
MARLGPARKRASSRTQWILPPTFSGITIVEVVVRHSSRDPKFEDAGRLLRLCRQTDGGEDQHESRRQTEHETQHVVR